MVLLQTDNPIFPSILKLPHNILGTVLNQGHLLQHFISLLLYELNSGRQKQNLLKKHNFLLEIELL
jgi:hypothetical protein